MNIVVTPAGQFGIAEDTEGLGTLPDGAAAGLAAAFARSSGEGLLLLASHEFAQELPPGAFVPAGELCGGIFFRRSAIWARGRSRNGSR